MAVTQKLFTELFRPNQLDNVILLPRIKNELSKGLVTNLLLYGPPGSGKTTLARILTQGFDVLYLNGSAENGIDIVRNQITSFASQLSLEFGQEKIKVVYIDECDGFSAAAFDGMRETIEHYASSVRFIMTCNRIDKVRSRRRPSA